jgi:hypothetical protein
MESFYLIVVSIALITLVIFLTLVGLLMRNIDSSTPFPPTVNMCPDYWRVNADGSCSMPIQSSFNDVSSVLNTGKNKTLLSNPNVAPYSKNGSSFSTKDPLWTSNGETVECAQKNWASTNNILWDGISNYNMC